MWSPVSYDPAPLPPPPPSEPHKLHSDCKMHPHFPPKFWGEGVSYSPHPVKLGTVPNFKGSSHQTDPNDPETQGGETRCGQSVHTDATQRVRLTLQILSNTF